MAFFTKYVLYYGSNFFMIFLVLCSIFLFKDAVNDSVITY